ncbi:MAG: CHAT domain-containing protein [Akkermansiaceae bacterium]
MSEGDVIDLIGRLSQVGKVLKGDNDDQEYKQLIEWERESRVGLELLGKMGPIEEKVRAGQVAFLLNFRGVVRISRYDIDGNHAVMMAGLDDHREAVAVSEEFGLESEREDYQQNLAKALVRAGEQCGDIGLLREALVLLEAALTTDDPGQWPAADYDLVNALCVAHLRLGCATGDRAMVEKAVRQLQAYLKRDGLGKEGKTQTLSNTIAALAENARQNRSIRVYQQTIAVLERMVIASDENRSFLFQYLASLKTELSYLNGDLSLVHQAISDFEKSLEDMGSKAGLRMTVLHQLGHAHFLLGKVTASIEDLEKAILRNEEAEQLIADHSSETDSRMARLIGDRASYYDAIGLLASREDYLEEGKHHHKIALELVEAKTSPWLRSKIASGYFYHCYVRGHWEEPIAAFAEVEEAWGIVTVDPTLSSEIHDQRAVELAPHYARAALCRLATGAVSLASSVVDRGRAQQLTAASRVNPANLETDGNRPDARISQATAELALAQKEGDDDSCRQAWKGYRNTLHQLGGHLNVLTRSPEELLEAAPHDGVFIQIFGADGWLKAIIIDRTKPSFSEINFPNSVAETILKILHGDPERGLVAWRVAYHQFRNMPEIEEASVEGDIFKGWDQTITHCLRSIGSVLMEPLHRFLLEKGYPVGSTVLLSPPGELASLPLNSMMLEDGSVFSTHWNLSLVPNSALVRSEGYPTAEGQGHRMLIVSQHSRKLSASRGSGFLSFAAIETEVVASHLSAESRHTLDEEALNLAGVLKAQENCSIVHFACHGAQNSEKPDLSGLSLPSGDLLTLARLRATPDRGTPKRLAVLSCCETGISGRTVPADEFVGLLPTLLQAGFRGAIGTLWPVYDDAAMCLMDRFYRIFLAADGSEQCPPAEALAKAQEWLSDVSIGELVEIGLLNLKQALRLVESRFAGVRLRIQPVDESPTEDWETEEEEEIESISLSPEQLEFKPFTSPVDWAPFILVGQ